MRKLLLLIPIAVFALPNLRAQVDLRWEGNDLIAYSQEKADEGFVGCEQDGLEPAIPYFFELYIIEEVPCLHCPGRMCKGTPELLASIPSEIREVIFSGLFPEKEYEVICRVGKSQGCLINSANRSDGKGPERAIIYQRWQNNSRSVKQALGETTSAELTKKQLQIFPNPFSNQLNLRFTSSLDQTVEVVVYNSLGQALFMNSQEMAIGENKTTLNLESLKAAGLLLIQLKEANGVIHTQQVIKIQKDH